MKATSIFRTALAVAALASYPFSSAQDSVFTMVRTATVLITTTFLSTSGAGGSGTSATVTSVEISMITATTTAPRSTAAGVGLPQPSAPVVPGFSVSQIIGSIATATVLPGIPPLSTASPVPAPPGGPAIIATVGVPAPPSSNTPLTPSQPANVNTPIAQPLPPAARPSAPPPGTASYPPAQSSSFGKPGNVVPIQGSVPNSPNPAQNSVQPQAPQPPQVGPSVQQPPLVQPTNTPHSQPTNGRNAQTGSDGQRGSNGKNGQTGSSGTNGGSGSNGGNGKDGKNDGDGSDGRDGRSGKNGKDGKTSDDDSGGSSGQNGRNGDDGGGDGATGSSGRNGRNGSDGQSGNRDRSDEKKSRHRKSCSIFCGLSGFVGGLVGGAAGAARGALNTAGQIVGETGKVIQDGTLFFDRTAAQVYDSANNLVQGGIDSVGNVIDTSGNIIPGGMISVPGIGVFPPPFNPLTGISGQIMTNGGQPNAGSINSAGEIIDGAGKSIDQGRFMVTEGGTVTNGAGQTIQGGIDTAGNVIDTAGNVVEGGKIIRPGGVEYVPRMPLPTPVVNPAPIPPAAAAPNPPVVNPPAPTPLPATPQASLPAPSSPVSTPSRSPSMTTPETSTSRSTSSSTSSTLTSSSASSSSSATSTSESSSSSTSSSDSVSVTTVTETTITATTTEIDGTLNIGGTVTHAFTTTAICKQGSQPCEKDGNKPIQGFDFAGHLGWIDSKLKKGPLFFANLIPPESLEKCDKPMTPLEFVSRVKRSGMKTDDLVKHLPDEPSKGTSAHEKWATYLKPFFLCDKTYDMRLPLKPDRSWNYASAAHYKAALKNYVDLFTDETTVEISGLFPVPNSPPCPPWAIKQLAKTAIKLKQANHSTRKDNSEFPYMASLEHRRMCLPQINGVLDLPRRGQYLSNEIFKDDLKQWDLFVDRLARGEEATPAAFHQDSKDEPPQEQLPSNSPDAEALFHQDFQLPPRARNFVQDPYIGLNALVASWGSQIDAPAPKGSDLLDYAHSVELQQILARSGIPTSDDWFHHDQLAAVIDEWALRRQGFRVQLGLWATGFVDGQQSNTYYISNWVPKNSAAIRLWIALGEKMSKQPEYIGLLRNNMDDRPTALPPAGTKPSHAPPNEPLTAEKAWEEDFWGEKDVYFSQVLRDDLSGLHALVESWEFQMKSTGPTFAELEALLEDKEVVKILNDRNIPRTTPYVNSHQIAVIIDVWAFRKHKLHIILGLVLQDSSGVDRVLEDHVSKQNPADVHNAPRIWIYGESANGRVEFGGAMPDSWQYGDDPQDQPGERPGQDRQPTASSAMATTCKPDLVSCTPTLQTGAFNYDLEIAWINAKFQKTTDFLGVKASPLAKCNKAMKPDDFFRRVGESGMKTDILAKHIPPRPQDALDKTRTTKAYREWRNFLEPVGLCDKTWDQLFPLKPDPSWQWERQEHYDLALANWSNFFTRERTLRTLNSRFPQPQKLPCQPGALKTLAEIGQVLATKKIFHTSKDREAKADTIPFIFKARKKEICLPQVDGVLDMPRETEYSRKKEWKSDLKLWNEFVGRLEQGEEAQPPVLHRTIPGDDQRQTSSLKPPTPAEAEALFRKDFPKEPPIIATPQDERCGVLALIASWKKQFREHKEPTTEVLYAWAENEKVHQFTKDHGLTPAGNWLIYEELAAMIDLWAFSFHKVHVQLGVYTKTTADGREQNSFQLSDYVLRNQPAHVATAAYRLWIFQNPLSSSQERLHFEGLEGIDNYSPPPKPLNPADWEDPDAYKAFFKSDFPSGAVVEKVAGDGLCGLHAIIASWHAQFDDYKAPTLSQLQKMTKDKDVVSLMKKRGVKVVETWFDSQQLAAMINLWSYRKYGKMVQLGLRVRVGSKYGYQIEDHVSKNFRDGIWIAGRLWIHHTGQDQGGAHYDGLVKKVARAKRVGNVEALELGPVKFALSNSTLVSTKIATISWGTPSASSPAFARTTSSSTTLKTLASTAASISLEATPNAWRQGV